MPSVSPIPVANGSARASNKSRLSAQARKRADRQAGLPGTGKRTSRLAASKAKNGEASRSVKPCACGCGEETTGYFAPGHDARVHGVIKKLADGRLEPKDYPFPKLIKNLDLVKTVQGYKAKSPHFWKD